MERRGRGRTLGEFQIPCWSWASAGVPTAGRLGGKCGTKAKPCRCAEVDIDERDAGRLASRRIPCDVWGDREERRIEGVYGVYSIDMATGLWARIAPQE